MAASDRKTRPTAQTVDELVAGIEDERRRADVTALLALLGEVTGEQPVVWTGGIIGFGDQPYTTADGRQHQWMRLGFANRKAALTLYGLTYYGSNVDLLDRLGKHTTGKGCLYIKRLSDVDRDVLFELAERAWAQNSD
ncbi:DUF1801 domain-containing protein [Propionibacteriaceae bacterium G1746]